MGLREVAIAPCAAGYGQYLLPRLRGLVSRMIRPDSREAEINRELRGYPRNHDYQVVESMPVPGRKLHSRWKRIAGLYPERLTSLLDVGCCKGYFVLEAARRESCERAVGIDVYEPFVALSREVARQVKEPKAGYYTASLDGFVADPVLKGMGPFQTVLLLNVYHYLYAGSELSPLAYRAHRPILALLHELCSDRVIFSSPLELADCPEQVRENCRGLGIGESYTRKDFMEAAEEFFRVEEQGVWGRRPLLVLYRR
ncbi:MAG TPA: class I SAM-dependent methyltransferase [Tepidisphaeraceae bacterium]|jgi:SAM-dependent methyltransferase|nr:class I SAM-dependent methyltransferase [Tepidisphaeraceae bacterium]